MVYPDAAGDAADHLAYAKIAQDALVSRRNGRVFPGMAMLRRYLRADSRYSLWGRIDESHVLKAIESRFSTGFRRWLVERHSPIDEGLVGRLLSRTSNAGRSSMKTMLLVASVFDSVGEALEKLAELAKQLDEKIGKVRPVAEVEREAVALMKNGVPGLAAARLVGLDRWRVACLKDEHELHEQRVVKPVSAESAGAAERLMLEGLSTVEIRRRNGVDNYQIQTIYRSRPGLRRRHVEAIAQKELLDSRATIQKALSDNPGIGRWELYDRWTVAYNNLLASDRQWLDQNVPTYTKRAKARNLEPSIMRKNWEAVDEQLYIAVRQAFDAGYASVEDRPYRLSKNKIIMEVFESPRMAYARKSLLLRTWEELEKRQEGKRAFGERLISWALSNLSCRHRTISLAYVAAEVSLDVRRIVPYRAHIEEQARRMGMAVVDDLRL